MPVTPQLDTIIGIGGYQIPSFLWNCENNAYGQLGRASITTTITSLQKAGIDINVLSSGTYIPVTIDLNGVRVFGGHYFSTHLEYHRNEVQIVVRDYAGRLFDIQRSIADITNNHPNIKLGELIQLIAALGGIPLSINIGAASQIPVGTITNDGNLLATQPVRLWTLLVFLARYAQATVYTTPQGILHFDQVQTSPTAHSFTWLRQPENPNALGPPAPPPILRLEGLHQPARNKNFTVIVTSHHEQFVQTYESTVTVNGESISVPGLKTVPRGTYTGSGAGRARSALSQGSLNGPVYIINKPGLTAIQVKQLAASTAQDIASKLFVPTLVVSGNTGINVRDQLSLVEGIPGALLGFAGWPLYMSSVAHSFDMPQNEGIGGTGFLTTIKALTAPPGAVSSQAAEALFGEQ